MTSVSAPTTTVQRRIVAPESFIQTASDLIWAHLVETLQLRPLAHLCLTGGSTPRPIYQMLAERSLAGDISLDWSRVRFYFGDERSVPPDHPDSNYRMAKESLLEPLGIPAEHVARLEGEQPASLAATRYEALLRARFPEGRCAFDLLLLGMGDDGHCASLFPHTPGLSETERWVIANPVDKLQTTRLSLSFPALNGARQVLFLVNGVKKAPALTQVLERARDVAAWPSQGIAPTHGHVCWLLDDGAAGTIGPQ